MDIANFISNVGFPIACCMYLMYHSQLQEKNHKEEMEKMSKSIDNNTQALNELIKHIRGKPKNEYKSD